VSSENIENFNSQHSRRKKSLSPKTLGRRLYCLVIDYKYIIYQQLLLQHVFKTFVFFN